MTDTRKGSCNCGGVTFTVSGPLREVIACHCGQCRKQTGLYYAATNADDSDLEITKSDTLSWYAASDFAKRGFCSKCGSALFWKRNDSDETSILAGAFDGDIGVKIDRHIFVSDKADYYDIEDGLPRFDQSG